MTVAFGQRAAAALLRVDEVLATVPTSPTRRTRSRCPTPQPHGEVRSATSVRLLATAGRPVLDGFDLEIAAGQSVALVGATGGGKSTVARLLPRFYDVEEGSIAIDGVDIRDLAVTSSATRWASCSRTRSCSTTPSRATSRSPTRRRPPRIEAAARLAGAHDFVLDLPEGYDTLIGERGFSLSGGQRQRIAIARAILADPRVLVLDDATSAVDPSKEHEIRGRWRR